MAILLPDDAEIQRLFLDFLDQNNLAPVKNIPIYLDGKIHRYQLNDDKNGQTSGAYCLYTDRWPIGWAMDWKSRNKINWHFPTDSLNPEQKKEFDSPEFKAHLDEVRKKKEQEIKHRQAEASAKARAQFDNCPNAPDDFPYLLNKHIQHHDTRLFDNGCELILAIPLRDINGIVQSVQHIFQNGEKRFFYEAPLNGVFWAVGIHELSKDYKDVILLGEGFATMAKVHELTDKPSVASITCHKLPEIAQILRDTFPNCKIIITADNDMATEIKRGFNPGIKAATLCKNSGLVADFIFPTFNSPDDGTDWDDFAIIHGDSYTRNFINDKIAFAIVPDNLKSIIQKSVIVNAQDLRSTVFPPIKWAVDGFLPEGLSILAGGPKVGKSILALHLAVGVAIGGCVLGKIPVQKGRVLYLALEDTLRRLQDRINNGSFGDCNDDLSNLTLITQTARQHVGGTDLINFWLSAHKDARLVIIDTLQMFRKQLSGKGSMYSEDYETVSNIKSIGDNHHVAVLLLHHLKKGMEGDWLSEISGSQGIAGAADTIFSLKRERNSNMATLRRTGRDVEKKDFIMKLDGFGWTLQGDADDFIPEWKKQILDFLKENFSVTPMQLAEFYGLNISTAKMNLTRLVKEGTILKTGYGTYGLPEE